MSSDDEREAAAAAAAAKEVPPAASAAAAGHFSLTSLHAQVVGLSSIKGHVPVELALDTGVHRQWRTFFRAAVRKYALLDHLDGASPSSPPPEWTLLDATVVSWIYGSVSLPILDAVMTPGEDPSAAELWNAINGLFNDHKANRELLLSAELAEISMGDMTMTDYLQKLKSIADGLADLGSPVDDAKLVIHCLNGLSGKYEGASDLISLMVPTPTFAQCRSMLSLQEMKKKSRRSRATDSAFYSNNAGNGRGKKKQTKEDAAKDVSPVKPTASAPAAPAPTAPAPTTPPLTWPSPDRKSVV